MNMVKEAHETPVLRLRDGALAWREIEGEVVALDLESSNYLRVNKSGASLWGLLVEGTTTHKMAESLTIKYSLSPEQASKDVRLFLESLDQWGLLEI